MEGYNLRQSAQRALDRAGEVISQLFQDPKIREGKHRFQLKIARKTHQSLALAEIILQAHLQEVEEIEQDHEESERLWLDSDSLLMEWNRIKWWYEDEQEFIEEVRTSEAKQDLELFKLLRMISELGGSVPRQTMIEEFFRLESAAW